MTIGKSCEKGTLKDAEVREVVEQAGGVPVQSKSGHAFMKEVMRREDAEYGGEMSAHHFFKEFSYCDSGMIPWMLFST